MKTKTNDPPMQMPRKLAFLIDENIRYKIVYGGRGKGASWGFARALLRLGMVKPERILCTREIQRTIKDSVHYLLKRQIALCGYEDFYTVTDKSITGQNGTEFIFAGIRTHDISKLKSAEGITRCWVAEAHVISESSWEVLIPTIREDDSEIWIEFNPELDTDSTYIQFVENPPKDESTVVKMSYKDNPWFPNVLEMERKRAYENDKSVGKVTYNHIWEGKCRPTVAGAIFAAEVQKLFEDGRVRPLDYDSSGIVHGVWDLGWGVSALILVQKFASTIQIIGYLERTHATYADITFELKNEEPYKKYRWGKMFMPHDATHKDPKIGKSHFDVMDDLDWETAPIPDVGVENYIALGRDMFSNLYISDTCTDLIQCLRRFKRSIPVTTEHPGSPKKDEFSHGAEAFCYTAVVADELVNAHPLIKDPYKGFESGYAA